MSFISRVFQLSVFLQQEFLPFLSVWISSFPPHCGYSMNIYPRNHWFYQWFLRGRQFVNLVRWTFALILMLYPQFEHCRHLINLRLHIWLTPSIFIIFSIIWLDFHVGLLTRRDRRSWMTCPFVEKQMRFYSLNHSLALMIIRRKSSFSFWCRGEGTSEGRSRLLFLGYRYAYRRLSCWRTRINHRWCCLLTFLPSQWWSKSCTCTRCGKGYFFLDKFIGGGVIVHVDIEFEGLVEVGNTISDGDRSWLSCFIALIKGWVLLFQTILIWHGNLTLKAIYLSSVTNWMR